MKKIKEMYLQLTTKGQMAIERIKEDETGSFGVKEIAGTLAVVVVIAAVATLISGDTTLMGGWIGDIWDFMTEAIDDMF